MTTPAQERLSKLFAKTPLPPKPPLPVPVSEQVEVEQQPLTKDTTTSSEPHNPLLEMASNRPQQRRVNDNINNSSGDDDDYVAMFKKPKANVQHRREPESKRDMIDDTRVECADPLVPIKSLPEGKKSSRTTKSNTEPSSNDDFDHDDAGQRLVGRFCPFSLVTKFPYKYMQDGNDRVSKRYFAGGKIYLRTWDL